jgi:hypothetical protein
MVTPSKHLPWWCPWCGNDLPDSDRRRDYCSDDCKREYARDYRRRYRAMIRERIAAIRERAMGVRGLQ